MVNRRKFIKQSSSVGLGTVIACSPKGLFVSPNETVNAAIIGMGGRSGGILKAIALCDNVHLSAVCDVDQVRLNKAGELAIQELGHSVSKIADFRRLLDDKDIDAIFISTPEHWHAPMAILGMQAGKHVYVEKPCSHNPHENELLVTANRKYNKHCQMGNQQRSSVTSAQAVQSIHDGVIGNAYAGMAWYANTRGSIGNGKEIPVPDTLDWDLWQGPAPRENYRSNVHPYNWHWFRTWGTGEIHNNGTHEIDICRWALNVELPNRVVSTGGRLHYTDDDWQYYDTQLTSYEYDNGVTISWDGKSCNGMKFYNRGRGSIIYGTEGTMILDRGGYEHFDLEGKLINSAREENPGTSTSTKDTTGMDGLTVRHIQNFLNAIRVSEPLKAPITDGSISTQMCHLGNIAQHLEVSLDVDPATGKVVNNSEATAMWKREYEDGWEPKV